MAGERVAALVPCHLEPPPEELLAGLEHYTDEVLVVDDGLPLDAAARLARIVARRPKVECLALGRNMGKGHALARGIEHLVARLPSVDAVLVLDADGQHPVSSVPAFLAAAAQAELVVGVRSGDRASMPAVRRVANTFSSRLLARATAAPVPDGQCGMRLLRGRALSEIAVPGGRYESETVHLVDCLFAGVRVAWVPIPAVYGSERSSFRPLRDGLRVLRAIRRPRAAALTRRPEAVPAAGTGP